LDDRKLIRLVKTASKPLGMIVIISGQQRVFACPVRMLRIRMTGD